MVIDGAAGRADPEVTVEPARERGRVFVAEAVFSGDVGRYDVPLHSDPSPPPACDMMVIESTYGDRSHDHAPRLCALEIDTAAER